MYFFQPSCLVQLANFRKDRWIMVKTLTIEQIVACRDRIIKLKKHEKWPVQHWFSDEDFETALNAIDQLRTELKVSEIKTSNYHKGWDAAAEAGMQLQAELAAKDEEIETLQTKIKELFNLVKAGGKQQQEKWKAIEKINQLQAELAGLKELGAGEIGPHSSPENCPTFYDICHCTVKTLTDCMADNKRLKGALGKAESDVMMIVPGLNRNNALKHIKQDLERTE